MTIQCEKCGKNFDPDEGGIRPAGSDVRCPECGHITLVRMEDSFGGEAVEGFEFRYPINSEGTKTAEKEMHNGGSNEHEGVRDAEPAPRDEGNWEEFVNISKTERTTDDFRIEDHRDTKRQESDFNWESLRINEEPVDAVSRVPRMFEDEGTDDELMIMKDEATHVVAVSDTVGEETRPKERAYVRHSPENLSVDMDVLAGSAHAAGSYRSAPGPSYRDTFRIHPTRERQGGGFFARAAYTLLTLIVFAVIVGASYIILSNTGIIPKESADRIERLVSSLVPVGITGSLKHDIMITAHGGKWLDTRNGPMYVVSGTVTNESEHPVSYIKIRSEFISEGQIVYDNVVYAGNTFTENELRVSPLQDTLLKLKKRSGDVDFYNAEKLAGLNSNIQPGESIPFYTVFPASGRMLGLKYDLEVAGYE
ncbi:MAG: zinc-ribbon domain-containing protein [Thermodesulfobacteriota bacterium]